MRSHKYYEREERIDTPRLWLRPMQEEDAETVVGWRNARETAAMFFVPPPSLAEHRRWFRGRRRGRADYMIIRRDEDRPVGVVNFRHVDIERGVAEGGKLLGDMQSRGQGMAKEAFAAWVLYGFGRLGLQRVMIRTREDNNTNIHLNRKLGFHIEDRYRQQAADGVMRRFVMMTLTRRDVLHDQYYREVDHQGYFKGLEGGEDRGRRR